MQCNINKPAKKLRTWDSNQYNFGSGDVIIYNLCLEEMCPILAKKTLKEKREEINQDFEKVWPRLVSELTSDKIFGDIEGTLDWLKIVLEKNVPYGKKFRGLALVHVFNYLVPDADAEETFLTYVCGWATEITSALIADDIMDESETRRGQPCWYRNADVGMSAVNDAFMLESIGYRILWKYASTKSYFLPILKTTQQNILTTVFGQSLDTRMSRTMDLDQFTQHNYESIVKYKTSVYTFYAPIQTAMIKAGLTDEGLFETVKELSLRIGYLFQVQDDFLDCYGNPKITGKIGSDIVDGKCSWLIVKALECASEEQRQILNGFYGTKNEDGERRIKSIYSDLDLIGKYRHHETDTFSEINKLIKFLPSEMPKEPFTEILNSIYKRNK